MLASISGFSRSICLRKASYFAASTAVSRRSRVMRFIIDGTVSWHHKQLDQSISYAVTGYTESSPISSKTTASTAPWKFRRRRSADLQDSHDELAGNVNYCHGDTLGNSRICWPQTHKYYTHVYTSVNRQTWVAQRGRSSFPFPASIPRLTPGAFMGTWTYGNVDEHSCVPFWPLILFGRGVTRSRSA